MTSEQYTHGHHESVLRSHLWRTAQNSAQFLLAELREDARVLDVGCGPGNISADLAARVARGTVTGIDQSPEVVTRARRDYPTETHPNLRFDVGDVFSLAFDDATFDVVYVHQVLQHLSDPVRALREMRRVVKDGGVVAARDADYGGFVWFPGDPLLERWMDLYHRVTERNGAQANGGRHLKQWVRAAGFEDVAVTSSNWTYESAEEREWWGGLWAERVVASDFARQAQEYDLATPEDLAAMSSAFRRWAQDPDAIFIVPSVEVLARH
ncbi:MAG: methyltransferase domain-containing protein [Acidobacteria bacterium]|nr:methyltransferase domain-containing protein [Acidobacteriota bacterium]